MKAGSATKHPSMRPAVFILLTLALSTPTLANIVGGSESAMGAGERLGAAILVSWAAVSVVGHLVDKYRVSVARRSASPQSVPHGTVDGEQLPAS